MMFTRDRPAAARDFSELCGDPWATGVINDAPNPEERSAWAEQYDQNVEASLASIGITRDRPDYDAHYRAAVNADMTIPSGGPMEHGHELPMSKRDALLYAPQSQWEQAQVQGANANALLQEYARRNPDMTMDGLHEAVAATTEYYQDRGEAPMANPSKFLNDVAAFHRGGVTPQRASADRTSGIGSGTGTYAPSFPHPEDDEGLVGDIRDMQRQRGW